MAQRTKISRLIDKAQAALHEAKQENAPLWVGSDLQTCIDDLERIQQKLMQPVVPRGWDRV